MKHLSLLTFAISLTIAPCYADGQRGLFREAYACSDRGPSSVCIYGTIPKGKQVTVFAKGWKSPARQKEQFPTDNEYFNNGVKTSTRLEVAAPPPKDVASMIAVLAPADAINELPLEEVQNEALLGRISQFIKTTKELNLAPDIRLLKTSLLRLSPTILLSETFLASPADVAVVEKELLTGCMDCENVPILVGPTLTDLFKEIRASPSKTEVERTCGRIEFAIAVSGRSYVLSRAFACESDSFSATLIHDLSGGTARLAFKLSGGF